MAIVTRWDNRKKSIILLEFESEWTWDDLQGAVQKADSLIGGVAHTVHLIVDLEGAAIPGDIWTRAKDLLAAGEARPNEGARVVVGANGALRTIYQTLQRAMQSDVSQREVLFADSLSDARAIIRGQESDA